MPFGKPPKTVSRSLRPQEATDRRLYHRFTRHGLIVRLGQTLAEVSDISVGGLRLAGVHGGVGDQVDLQLIPRDGRQLNMSGAMWAKGEVVGHTGGCTRVRFKAMTYTLAKFLIGQLARQNGVEPYIFK